MFGKYYLLPLMRHIKLYIGNKMKDYQIESVLNCQRADNLINSGSSLVTKLAVVLYKEAASMGSHYAKARLEQLKRDGVLK